ncbi:glycosyltransferase family 4 protein [Flavobacteriaceae bacterium]|nr:glycosyltransferase family 4 protein [Flavobacteriaceae bacterium]
MRILFLTDNFPPETNAPATRTYEHCLKWIELGHKVTVITCFPNFPKGKVFEGYTNKLYQKENIDGITVIRVWSYIAENNGFVKRIIDYISFALTSFLVGLFVKTDLIIATSPQFFTAISGKMLSVFKQRPWLMEVRDLWPDSIAAVGSMNKSSKPFKILKKIEHHLYLSASKIVVVTDSFKKYIIKEHQIKAEKVGVFKNGVIINNFKKPKPNDVMTLKESLGLKNKIIISYLGTHGLAHGLKFILESISKISNPDLHFLFIGDGAEKENLIKYSKTLHLKNFTFLESVTKSEIPLYIEMSDYSLVNLKKSDEFKNVIPSKIFENIAMYKPILLGVEGESKKLIDDYEVGVCFEPENIESFLNALCDIQKLDRESFKVNCNKMLADFDRNNIAENLIKFIV